MKRKNVFTAVEFCKRGDPVKAKEFLIDILQAEAIGLILAKSAISNEQDALSIFYDAVLEQIDEMTTGKFKYINDAKFLSYFKSKCIMKAREFNKMISGPFIPMPDIEDEQVEIIMETYNETRKQEYQRLNEHYGLDLKPDYENIKLPAEVMDAFHNLQDKCKMLIILRKIMKISHKKIVDSVGLLYSIGNENSCKNTLKRCWKSLLTSTENVCMSG
ncbi:MAG: hypothetical protein K8R53_02535 [Bacteroidales bacterium]|nr:hypothetical protein [Bacteroidales bacterium]